MRIARLKISRFKSIRDLELACRKVNLFIGPPDTGKTNILDALTFLSGLSRPEPIDAALRLVPDHGFEPLFFRQFFDQPIEIGIDDDSIEIRLVGPDRQLNIMAKNPPGLLGKRQVIRVFGEPRQSIAQPLAAIRSYAFAGAERWQYEMGDSSDQQEVAPPNGQNLMYVARHNQEVYDFLKQQLAGMDWKLRFDQTAQRFRLSEVRQDDILDYNIELLSDSIKRFFFYGAILLTSRDAVLVFDEPDVQAFPPYPKELGRMIAEDPSNQFFLTTHNPYFLTEIVEKTPRADLAVFVCRRDSEKGTVARLLDQGQVEQIIDWGANTFFNLSKFEA